MRASRISLVLAACLLSFHASATRTEIRQGVGFAANPIRKVVSMLQMMQKKVTEEGEAEKELYEKFMCYCKTSGDDLSKSIQAAEDKVPQLESSIQEAEEQKAQLETELQEAQESRAAGKKTLAEAAMIRDKEAKVYSSTKADYESNIAAIEKAVTALEKGMAGAFLQTDAAAQLQRLVVDTTSTVLDDNRDTLMAFLQRQGRYAPQSGEITGILKQLGDEMKKNLADSTAAETSAVQTYEALEVAKKKEVEILGAKIESTLGRIGELGVSITQMKDDLTDTEEALAADKEFLSTLETGCSTKTSEWEERQKTRAAELVALGDTIKVLNDDDALELFKKTLPSAAASFMQVQTTASEVRSQALSALQEADTSEHQPARVQLDLIELALNGRKIGFERIVGMIDDMVATLKTEQVDDDKKKSYCAAEFDTSDDTKKTLERSISDASAAIDQAEDSIATLEEEIKALTAGIKALDKSVAEATATRKKEHEEYTELIASDSAAKELLGFAKNRLNKFYSPKLYKPPEKVELSDEDEIYTGFGGAVPVPAPGGIAGTGIAAFATVGQHGRSDVAPPPPPDTFGAYSKKTEETNGVIAMIDLLIKDLDQELAEAEVEEKNSQKAYEALVADSAKKRAADAKSVAQKEKAKAELEVHHWQGAGCSKGSGKWERVGGQSGTRPTQAELELHKDGRRSARKERRAILKYIASLHADCDWLLQYHSMRKEARDSEIDALAKAKAVLSGADYSLLQTGLRRTWRHVSVAK